jgi:Tfp pilus assembly protein PilO
MSEQRNKMLSENRYGMPLPARRKEFTELIEEARKKGGTSHRIENFQGKVASLPIIRVLENLPKYRIANGRTSSIHFRKPNIRSSLK